MILVLMTYIYIDLEQLGMVVYIIQVWTLDSLLYQRTSLNSLNSLNMMILAMMMMQQPIMEMCMMMMMPVRMMVDDVVTMMRVLACLSACPPA